MHKQTPINFLFVLLITALLVSALSAGNIPMSTQLCYGSEDATLYFADGYHGGLFLTDKDELVRACNKILSLLDKYEAYKVNLEIESYTWEELARSHPDLVKEFKKYLEDGRVELVSGSYAQLLMFPILGESAIHQLQTGKRVIKDLFNYDAVTYACQEPCFTSQLPQILSSLEYKYCVLKNTWCLFGNPPAPSVDATKVWWNGPDGSLIETSPRYSVQPIYGYFLMFHPSHKLLEDCEDANIIPPITFAIEDFQLNRPPYVPWFNEKDLLQNKPSWLAFTTWQDYFTETPEPTYHYYVTQDDFEMRFPWGLAAGMVQERSREAEVSVLAAERIATLATLYTSKPYPEYLLDKAWRHVMLSQHHDSWVCATMLFGEWARKSFSSFKELVVEWSNLATGIGDDIVSDSCGEIGAAVNTIPEFNLSLIAPIIVLNPSSENRTDTTSVSLSLEREVAKSLEVLDVKGKVVPSQIVASTFHDDGSLKDVTLILLVDIPSLGYRTHYLVPAEKKQTTSPFKLEVSGDTLRVESEVYSLTFDKAHGGSITSLYDKDLEKEFLDQPDGSGNDYVGWIPNINGFSQSSSKPASVTVAENGPVRVCIRVEGVFHEHPYVTRIYLYNTMKRIDFEVSFDFGINTHIGASGQPEGWQNNGKKLQVAFPLSIDNGDMYVDAPFDVFKVTSGSSYSLTWVDVSNETLGLSLFFDRTTAVQYRNNRLSAIFAYGGTIDCPYWSYNAPLSGNQTYRYSIHTHAGTWVDGNVPNIAEANTYRTRATLTTVHEGEKPKAGSIMSMATKDQCVRLPVITALECRNEEVNVRVFQPYNESKRIELSVSAIRLFNASDVRVVNLLGRHIYKPLIAQQTISLTLNPYELKTVKLASGIPIQRPPPPTVSLLSPKNRTYLVDSVSLIFTVSEPTTWIGYSLDGGANVTVAEMHTVLSGLSEGSHSLVVYAADTAGNVGVSETVQFITVVSTQDQFSTWAIVTIGAVVAMIMIIIYVKVSKR